MQRGNWNGGRGQPQGQPPRPFGAMINAGQGNNNKGFVPQGNNNNNNSNQFNNNNRGNNNHPRAQASRAYGAALNNHQQQQQQQNPRFQNNNNKNNNNNFQQQQQPQAGAGVKPFGAALNGVQRNQVAQFQNQPRQQFVQKQYPQPQHQHPQVQQPRAYGAMIQAGGQQQQPRNQFQGRNIVNTNIQQQQPFMQNQDVFNQNINNNMNAPQHRQNPHQQQQLIQQPYQQQPRPQNPRYNQPRPYGSMAQAGYNNSGRQLQQFPNPLPNAPLTPDDMLIPIPLPSTSIGPRGGGGGRGRGGNSNAPRGNAKFNPFITGGGVQVSEQTGAQMGVFHAPKQVAPFGAGVPLGSTDIRTTPVGMFPGSNNNGVGVRGGRGSNLNPNQNNVTSSLNIGLNNILNSSTLLTSKQLDSSTDFIDILGTGDVAVDAQYSMGGGYNEDDQQVLSDDMMMITPMHSVAMSGGDDMSMNNSMNMSMNNSMNMSMTMSRQPSRQPSVTSIEMSSEHVVENSNVTSGKLPEFNAPVFDWYNSSDFIPGYIPCVPPMH